jgi:hypothetical protein
MTFFVVEESLPIPVLLGHRFVGFTGIFLVDKVLLIFVKNKRAGGEGMASHHYLLILRTSPDLLSNIFSLRIGRRREEKRTGSRGTGSYARRK